MTESLIENPAYLESPKSQLKGIFMRLFWDLLNAEDFENFTTEENAQGLKVWPRFPQVRDSLPVITISFNGLQFSALTLNPEFTRLMTAEIDEDLGDDSGPGRRQGYSVRGIVSFDVTALSDHQRDTIIDKVMDLLIWQNNAADMDIRRYLFERGLVLNLSQFALAGDQEMPIGQTGDLIYTDGLAIPFYAEIYSPKKLFEPLEGIQWEAEIVPNS